MTERVKDVAERCMASPPWMPASGEDAWTLASFVLNVWPIIESIPDVLAVIDRLYDLNRDELLRLRLLLQETPWDE